MRYYNEGGVYHCTICGHRHEASPHWKGESDYPNTRDNADTFGAYDWQCPKCEAWITPDDEMEDEANPRIPVLHRWERKRRKASL